MAELALHGFVVVMLKVPLPMSFSSDTVQAQGILNFWNGCLMFFRNLLLLNKYDVPHSLTKASGQYETVGGTLHT